MIPFVGVKIAEEEVEAEGDLPEAPMAAKEPRSEPQWVTPSSNQVQQQVRNSFSSLLTNPRPYHVVKI